MKRLLGLTLLWSKMEKKTIGSSVEVAVTEMALAASAPLTQADEGGLFAAMTTSSGP